MTCIMGNCMAPATEADLHDREIKKGLKDDFKKQSQITKLLLLGTGESGKSTILKQMKIIANAEKNIEGLSDEEKKSQIDIIRNNVLDSVEAILDAATTFTLHYADKEGKEAQERCRANLLGARDYTVQVAEDVAVLWDHPITKEVVARKHEFQFLDSAPYFLSKAEKLVGEDYLPSDDDVLRARSMTTGIVTFPFEVKNKNGKGSFEFELIDVGGQRTERRKWIHCFEDVTAVLFIISLSDYNQTLYEDENTNRMQESEKVFGQMLNNFFFKNTSFIVFFNKVDLFREKLKTAPITIAYKDYLGKQDYDEALKFIRNKFLSQRNGEGKDGKDRELYDFVTSATDTGLVKKILESVTDIIINKIMATTGFA